ncbi:MAG TPA: ROK family protein [Alphaproteobacteria bacterium]|jgi:fructokinase|nr:ROK family protein [Alphaproteobacteria bacterium]
MRANLHRIGIDLGGTKIAGIVLNPEGRLCAEARVPTPRDDYQATLQAVCDLTDELERQSGVMRGHGWVGIGMPGALSLSTGLVKNANSTWLNGKPFDKDIAAALHRPVRIANDANCLAVSEATDGAGEGKHVVFGVILGTGCGGGIAIDGVPVTGLNAIAGEWGHNPLPWPTPEEYPGPKCYCGKQGCIEMWLSGPGIAADHKTVTGEAIDSVAIAKAAADGDAAAKATLDRHRNRLARSLAGVINILDPDIVVIGGGVSQLAGLYEPLPVLLAEWCFSDGVFTPVVPALHGDTSGVRGAAWLWPRQS